MSNLVEQYANVRTGTKKVATGAAIGAPISVILAWALNAFAAIDVPTEVSAAIGSMITTIVSMLTPARSSQNT